MLDLLHRMRKWTYSPLVGFVIILAVLYIILIPWNLVLNNWRPAALAFFFGALVGVSEIASRYRDEPLHAIWSSYGLIYTVLNGAISVLSLLLIFRYKATFPAVANDRLLAAITAGFGSTLVMRTRLAVIKGPDNKDVSIGPDYVISILLKMFDQNIDRLRATKRQAIVVAHLDQIRSLGSFRAAEKYLLASLLAFQNLDETMKNQLRATFDDYEKQTPPLPEDIKYLALGFVFLTIVGESHFASVLDNAVKIRTSTVAPPPTPPPTPPSASVSPPSATPPSPTVPSSPTAVIPPAATTPPSPSASPADPA